MRWGVTLAVGILAAALLPAPAAGAPTWLPPVPISSPGEENSAANLAVGPDGTVIAVWQRGSCVRQNDAHKCTNGRIQYSVRQPGASFSPPTDMPGDPGPANSEFPPVVAFDGAGNAIAAWTSGTLEGIDVRYSVRPPGGAFGPTETVPDPDGTFHIFPDLAIAPDGRAVLTFQRVVGEERLAGYSVRTPGGGFGPAKSMVGDPGVKNLNGTPRIELDSAGGGIAHWTSTGPDMTNVRYAEIAPGATEFTPTQTLAQGGVNSMAMAPSGATVVVWSPLGAVNEVLYSFRPPGGSFGAPLSIPEPDNPLGPQVAIAPDGSAIAAWTSQPPGHTLVRWAAAPPGGPFGAVAPMSPAVDPAGLRDLEISAQGTALALWFDGTDPLSLKMMATLRPPGGSFETPTLLPTPPPGASLFGAAAAFDPQGNAAVIWPGLDPITSTPHDVPLFAAGLDAAGPLFQTLDTPTRGRDDRATRVMRMKPLDVWSAVASTRFEFGDGTGSPEQEVRHRYRRAGAYSVTASATDAVGNTSSALRPIRIINTKPSISALKLTPRAFAVTTAGKSSASRRAGTMIRFRLTERATVRLTVLRPRRGGKAGSSAGKRLRPVGRIVLRNRRSGKNRTRFNGKVGGRALSPGSYRVLAVAVDATKKKSKPRRAPFQVLSAGG